MRKKHLLSSKLPILSMLLSIVISAIVIMSSSDIVSSPVMGYYVSSVTAVLCLLLFKLWFSPEYRGCFRTEVPYKEIKVLLIAFAVKCVLSVVFTAVDSGFYFKPTATALAMAVAAGFGEETLVRGLAVPIGMRYLKNKNRSIITAIFTSLIFGAMHMGNATQGASVTMAALQSVAAAFAGLLFCAVFLRTGNILISVFMHALYDWLCFVTDPTLKDGVMMNESVTIGLILALALDIAVGIWALYLIRPAMRDKIEAVWDKKWSGQRTEVIE